MSVRFRASMVLSAVGDALGFRNGRWEFCQSGPTIHKELKGLGGLHNIVVSVPNWRVSDDTVMHLATAEALVKKSGDGDKDALFHEIAAHYQACMEDMQGRSPGGTCMSGACSLNPGIEGGYYQPFDKGGGGCGAAMRAMCIGLRYSRPDDVDDLIAVSVESGRMTHHHPTGYLGSFAAALMTAYSIQGKPVREWGCALVALLPRVLQYVESQGRYVQENKDAWTNFEWSWKAYLKLRHIQKGDTDPVFPEPYGVKERDAFYNSISYGGWGGASGNDACIIAYDALLGSGDSWEELCNRGMFHYGDSDSTGVIAGACFGAMYGFKGVPPNNYIQVEYFERITSCADHLFQLSGLSMPGTDQKEMEKTAEKPSDLVSKSEGHSTEQPEPASEDQTSKDNKMDSTNQDENETLDSRL